MANSGNEIWWLLIIGTSVIVTISVIFIGSVLFHQRRFIASQKEKVRILEENQEKLQEYSYQLRKLSVHLQSVREEERTRISREIHDELGQLLTVIKMDLSLLNKKVKIQMENKYSEVICESLAAISEITDSTIKSVRKIATQLRPEILDELGLREAIAWETRLFEERTKIRSRFVSSMPRINFDKELTTAIFRIYQETLTNVARHADASQVNVSFEMMEGYLELLVIDNGRGISPELASGSKSLGLLGMKERAHVFGGVVTINGEQGKGTQVSVKIPWSSTDHMKSIIAEMKL